jgi:hypothetical protein
MAIARNVTLKTKACDDCSKFVCVVAVDRMCVCQRYGLQSLCFVLYLTMLLAV